MPGILNPYAFGGFTGIADIVSGAWAAWGVMSATGAYAAAGNPALDLRRSSDNGTMTANFLTTGGIDTAAITTWAGGANVFVSRAYDSTGNGRHVSQATAGSQPQLILSGGPGGAPYLETATSGNTLAGSTNYPAGSITSMVVVGNRGGTNNASFVRANCNSCYAILGGGAPTANQWGLTNISTAPSFSASATDNTWHDAVGVINGSSSVLTIDGTDTTGTVSSSATSQPPNFLIGRTPGAVRASFAALYPSGTALNSTERAAIRAKLRAWPVAW